MKRFGTILFVCLFLAGVLTGCAQTKPQLNKQPSSKERAEAKEKLGVSLVQEGKLQEGLKELLEASELDPGNPDIHNSIGLAYRGLREYDKAVIHLERALALRPNFPEALNNLGMVYAFMKRWDSAIALFEKVARNDLYEMRHTAWENLGTVYYYKGEYRKAAEYYTKAIDLEPTYGPAYEKVGLCYEKMEDWTQALLAYRRAVQLSPNNPQPLLYLGRLYMKRKQYDEAEKALVRVLDNDLTGVFTTESRRLLEEIKKARDGGTQ